MLGKRFQQKSNMKFAQLYCFITKCWGGQKILYPPCPKVGGTCPPHKLGPWARFYAQALKMKIYLWQPAGRLIAIWRIYNQNVTPKGLRCEDIRHLEARMLSTTNWTRD